MPEEQLAAVYSSGDGTLAMATNARKSTRRKREGILAAANPSSSIFMTRDKTGVFAATQSSHVLTIVNQSSGTAVGLGLPNVYWVSVNPGGPRPWLSSRTLITPTIRRR